MKTYLVYWPSDEYGATEVASYTETQILKEYWDHWKGLMVKKYGEGHYLINEVNCIDDWVVVNWAQEKK